MMSLLKVKRPNTVMTNSSECPFHLDKLPLSYSYIPAVNKGMTDGSKWMLLLHGRGDNKSSYEVLAKEINVTGVNFLALNAPFPMPMGFMEGYSWYDEHFDPQEIPYRKSIELLIQTIETLYSQGLHCSDLFVLGFSQGGRMAIDLLHHLETPIAGAMALSPRMSSFHNYINPSQALTKTPIFSAHGALDPIIPYSETKAEIQRMREVNPQIEFQTYEIGHEIDIMEIIDLRNWLNELI